jgi:Golgi apparatus protein 1
LLSIVIRIAQSVMPIFLLNQGGEINSECRKEMLEHRKNLMSDFKLSPGIVTECNDEIEKYCRGFERGGKTLHCLFRNSKKATSKTDTDFKKSCLFEVVYLTWKIQIRKQKE